MTDFDLVSTTTRILECVQCDEPVAVMLAGGSRVSLRCGYCGFDDARELGTSRAESSSDDPYRGRNPRTGRKLRIDLSGIPDSLSLRSKLPEIRTAYLGQKKRNASSSEADRVDSEADRVDDEFRLLHVGTFLAARQLGERDYLHARAVLETVLESVTTPAYRALALIRLARIAALCKAPELAEKWLAVCPSGLRIAEVTSDFRVAEAFIARARGDAKGVLAAIGERDTANELVGNARWIGIALRVDGHEKLGEMKLAHRIWIEQGRGHRMLLQSAAVQFGLAEATRRKVMWRGLIALVVLCVGLFAALAAVRAIEHGTLILPWFALLIASIGAALLVRRL